MAARPAVALYGAGVMATAHALAARLAGADVVSVTSPSGRSAERLAAQHGARALPAGQAAAVADAVVVATPPPAHASEAARALLAGPAVLVETPLCTTLADADVLVAADPDGRRLQYAENLAHAPVVLAMLDRVGGLGTLTQLEVRALQPRPAWRAAPSPAWGGGALFDLGVHPVAVALLLAAPAVPVSVRAEVEQPADLTVDDHGQVTITFDSGLDAVVTASWRTTSPLWDAQVVSATAVLRAELLPEPRLERNGDEVALPPPDPAGRSALELAQYGYLGQVRALLGSVAAGRPVWPDARFGRTVLEVVCAAYRSAGRGGTTVTVPFAGPRDRTPWELWQHP